MESESSTFARHNHLVNVYKSYKSNASGDLTAFDKATLRQHHQFVRNDEDDARQMNHHWEVRMARKYYNKLFKEYALADLSRYTEGKVGLRWRTENEVVVGKGQFTCGSLSCDNKEELHSYEVPFRYKEQGVVKEELVKVRVCPECAEKLYYKKMDKVKHTKYKKHNHRSSGSSSSSNSDTADSRVAKKRKSETALSTESVKKEKKEEDRASSRSAADILARTVREEARKVSSDTDMDAFLGDLFM